MDYLYIIYYRVLYLRALQQERVLNSLAEQEPTRLFNAEADFEASEDSLNSTSILDIIDSQIQVDGSAWFDLVTVRFHTCGYILEQIFLQGRCLFSRMMVLIRREAAYGSRHSGTICQLIKGM